MALGELPNGRHCDACRASNMESEAKSRQYPNVSFWTEDGGLRCAIRYDRLKFRDRGRRRTATERNLCARVAGVQRLGGDAGTQRCCHRQKAAGNATLNSEAKTMMNGR